MATHKCPTCRGTGEVIRRNLRVCMSGIVVKCPRCDGAGKYELVWITDPADGVLRLAKYDPQN
jgi:DnaJ-class molecular chaperone